MDFNNGFGPNVPRPEQWQFQQGQGLFQQCQGGSFQQGQFQQGQFQQGPFQQGNFQQGQFQQGGFQQEQSQVPFPTHPPKENIFFNLDAPLLRSLGFLDIEVRILNDCVNMFGLATRNRLASPPFCVNSYTNISRLMYAYQISMGKVAVDSDNPEWLAKHFKKMYSFTQQPDSFSLYDIPHSEISIVPRTAVVAGLPSGNFQVLNSCRYPKQSSTYKVKGIAQEWVTIYSFRKMGVGHQDRLTESIENRTWGIPGILKVESVGSFADKKPWIISIHKSRCRLCNRFIIVATTRKSEAGYHAHHGGYLLITDSGHIIRVYAKSLDLDAYGNPKDKAPKSTRDTVVLSYGFFSEEVEPKLSAAWEAITRKFNIVYSKKMPSLVEFEEIPEYNGMSRIAPEETVEEEDFDPDSV